MSETPKDPRAQRLVRNEVIRQRNKERLAANKDKPRHPLTTIVMNPKQ